MTQMTLFETVAVAENNKKEIDPIDTLSVKRPDGCALRHLLYLDNLREKGSVNMHGARPYLVDRFFFDEKTAGEILKFWMSTLEERVKRGDKVVGFEDYHD